MVKEKRILFAELWGFPGGHIDEGETLQQAAVRETKEEVNLDVVLVTQDPFYKAEARKEDRLYKYHAFMAKAIGGELEFDKTELLDACWLSFTEIQKINQDGKIRDTWIMDAILKAEYENTRH